MEWDDTGGLWRLGGIDPSELSASDWRHGTPGSATRGNALDHAAVVLFENRSLDNVLFRLDGPGDGKTF